MCYTVAPPRPAPPPPNDPRCDVRRLLRNMWTNAGTARELVAFLRHQKQWWLIPMVVVLVGFGLFLVFASASGVGPFIYSLF